MIALIESKKEELFDPCRRHGVKTLELFGSALSDRFDTEASDLDFLVEYGPERESLRDYFDFKFALEDLFGRDVDLIDAGAIRNPYFLEAIAGERTRVYADGPGGACPSPARSGRRVVTTPANGLPLRALQRLWDIQQAALRLASFAESGPPSTDRGQAILRAAAEGQILALGRALARGDEELPALPFRDTRSLAKVREALTLDASTVGDATIWEAVGDDLPPLLAEVEARLSGDPLAAPEGRASPPAESGATGGPVGFRKCTVFPASSA